MLLCTLHTAAPLWIPLALQAPPHEPPVARRVEHVDEYHGVEVHDPYRWMEDLDSEELRAWMHAQDERTRHFTIADPRHAEFDSRLRELNRFGRERGFVAYGSQMFFVRQEAGARQGVLCVQEGYEGSARVLIDPNPLSEDGSISLKSYSVSPGGRFVAFAIGGPSSWHTLRVLDVASGEELEDEVIGIRNWGVAWTHDEAGFYYRRYDLPPEGEELTATPRNARIAFHRLGEPQSRDELVYHRGDHPTWLFGGPRVTGDGRYLVWQTAEGASRENALYYKDLARANNAVVELCPDGVAAFTFEHNIGTRFLVRTDYQAPRERLVSIDLEQPDPRHWEDVLPQSDATLSSVSAIGGHLVCVYLQDARRRVSITDTSGALVREIPLADVGGVPTGLTDQPGQSKFVFGLSGVADPGSLYLHDLESGETEVFRRPELAWNPDDYVTEHVFYESRDGTRVPMFVCHRRDLDRSVPHPTLLYAYGAYGWASYPWFNPLRLAWMEMGGVFANPCIRGGGAYGASWHRSGSRALKQNGIDDTIAALEYLIEEGYTSPELLAAQGGSASGLIPAAVVNQRPDLMAAAVVNWPSTDIVRNQFTSRGAARVPEYGDVRIEEEFRAILAYSPYHNVPAAALPAIFVNAGEQDDVLMPWHAYKLTAALQSSQTGPAPIFLRVDWGGGHYPASSELSIQEWSDRLVFLANALQLEPTED